MTTTHFYPFIPSQCLCGCNEIVYGGKQYKPGHHTKTKEFRTKVSCRFRGIKHTEKWKKQNSERMKGNKHLLGYKFSEKSKRKMSNSRRGHRHTEETKHKISESNKGQVPWLKGKFGYMKHTEETKQLLREYRMKQKIPNRFTKPELKFAEFCDKYGLPYKYTGNSSFWIDNVNPDFVNCNGEKICIEIWGDYWHSRPNEIKRDRKRKRTLSKFGWERIVFWERDLEQLSDKEILSRL